MWLLDTPMQTGVADLSGPWTHADMTDFRHQKRRKRIRLQVEFGTVDGNGDFVPGTQIHGVNPVDHTIYDKQADLDGNGDPIPGTEDLAYTTAIGIPPEEGIASYYAGVKKEAWNILAAKGVVGSGTMI